MNDQQQMNIDSEGHVLYLDQELLDRKEVGFPPYKNKPDGLGIWNWILKNLLYMSKKRWPLALRLYHIFVKYSVWMKAGGWKARLYKTAIKLYPDMDRPTGTVVMPLNIDVTEAGEKTVIPLDLIRESLKRVSYIAGMDRCLCRDANDCAEYPHDLGCLFLGEAAKIVVKHELGRQLSYEEACARVDEAAKAGLMGQAVWIEVEQMLWGVPNDLMDHFLEICFCCPCCCITMKLARNATEKERHRFHPSGWTAVADTTRCIGCGECFRGENACPVEAISLGEDGRIHIDQEHCVGCGICRSRCRHEVIRIRQTMPMRKDIQEYFLKEYGLDLRLEETGRYV
ncbi:MAG: 4Fe-4S binding protein [Lachnospiraceae bacterium]|nr:4Fe-4S binding protein [Lachnospiraceae bacterium]